MGSASCAIVGGVIGVTSGVIAGGALGTFFGARAEGGVMSSWIPPTGTWMTTDGALCLSVIERVDTALASADDFARRDDISVDRLRGGVVKRYGPSCSFARSCLTPFLTIPIPLLNVEV